MGAGLALTFGVFAAAAAAPPAQSADATVGLRDGSRLVCSAAFSSLRIEALFAPVQAPVSIIDRIDFTGTNGACSVRFVNRDVLSGLLATNTLAFDSALGRVSIKPDQLASIAFAGRVASPTPAAATGGATGGATLDFGGLEWTAWRRQGEVADDTLRTRPQPRPGFNYGHAGNGRNALLVTHVGDPTWRNYGFECDVAMLGADPAYNPYGLVPSQRSLAILFRIADLRESWNEPGTSCYRLSVGVTGGWSLAAVYKQYCPSSSGYVSPVSDAQYVLASGQGLKVDLDHGNHIRVEVDGTRIRAWFDDESLADVVDAKMPEGVKGTTLDHGGVGFEWIWESNGWIANFDHWPLGGR